MYFKTKVVSCETKEKKDKKGEFYNSVHLVDAYNEHWFVFSKEEHKSNDIVWLHIYNGRNDDGSYSIKTFITDPPVGIE